MFTYLFAAIGNEPRVRLQSSLKFRYKDLFFFLLRITEFHLLDFISFRQNDTRCHPCCIAFQSIITVEQSFGLILLLPPFLFSLFLAFRWGRRAVFDYQVSITVLL